MAEAGGRYRYQFVFTVPAPPSDVWPLIAEAARWKDWSFLTTARLLHNGSPEPDGVGAVRRFAVAGVGSREEVVAFEPPRHLGYVGVKGIPARNYRADVVLAAEDGGTRITWTGSLDPMIPGTGALALAYARSAVGRLTRQLQRYVEQRVAS